LVEHFETDQGRKNVLLELMKKARFLEFVRQNVGFIQQLILNNVTEILRAWLTLSNVDRKPVNFDEVCLLINLLNF